MPFPPGRPGEAHYEGLDLSQYLASGKRGVFLLRLLSWDPVRDKDKQDNDSDRYATVQDSRLIVVTDLGLLAKRALDGSRDVFVQSIRTGRPVGGATVSILALNGQTLFSETSTADGDGALPHPQGADPRKEACHVSGAPGRGPVLPADRGHGPPSGLFALRCRRRRQRRQRGRAFRLSVFRPRHLSPRRPLPCRADRAHRQLGQKPGGGAPAGRDCRSARRQREAPADHGGYRRLCRAGLCAGRDRAHRHLDGESLHRRQERLRGRLRSAPPLCRSRNSCPTA